MDGIIFLLNQAGVALAQAHSEIERLTAEVSRLSTQKESSSGEGA